MYASVPEQFFSAALLHDIHKQLVKELEIEKVLDPELTATIKKILKVNRSISMGQPWMNHWLHLIG